MVRRVLVVLCLIVVMFLVGCSGLDQGEAGFVKLFNGKDLTGWEMSGNAKWFVEDGNLVGTQGADNAPGDLFTTNTYRDFVVTLTYRAQWPCNTGLWFRYKSPRIA
ncbi:MAG: 3-keto-disaccharide hydrolase, partial [Planctomycetota bacterium]